MVTLLLVLVAVGAVSVAVYGGMAAQTHRLARRAVAQDQRLATMEYVSERCEACEGSRLLGDVPCWRCDGTGRPPTDADRVRYLS
jgi:hypothetical protein